MKIRISVRRAAIEILDKLAPVTGEQEEHLATPDDCVRFRTAYLSSCLAGTIYRAGHPNQRHSPDHVQTI
jgi:hypothetical protein